MTNKLLTYLARHRVKIISVLIGALGGVLYWQFIGCASGSCPISSHWYTSTLYGMVLGYLIGDMVQRKPVSKSGKE